MEPLRTSTTAVKSDTQTRVIPSAAVLVTDLIGFSSYAASADVLAVESLLEFWDAAHHEVTAAHGGVVRLVMGDGYVLSFDDPRSAVAAWVDLQRRASRAGIAGAAEPPADGGKPLHFSAVGEVRLFRSAVYGLAANRADQRQTQSRQFGPDCLVLPTAVVEQLDPATREDLDVERVPAAVQQSGRQPDDEPLSAMRLIPAQVRN